jgi:hypothetical protein
MISDFINNDSFDKIDNPMQYKNKKKNKNLDLYYEPLKRTKKISKENKL